MTAALVATALPVQAAEPAEPTGYLVLLSADGTFTIEPRADLGPLDVTKSCGVQMAPTSNSCTLTGNTWQTVGWFFPPPPLPGAPVGAAAMSTFVNMQDANGNAVRFGCSWAEPNPAIPFPPFIMCRLYQFQGLASAVTANFHTGAWSPSNIPFLGPALPDTNFIEAGAGTYQTLLVTVS